MLTKNEIAAQIEAATGIKPVLSKRVMDSLATIVAEHVGAGNDITVPGLVKISWDYRKPLKKGERWLKGATRINNITKEESIAEADSPPVKPRARMKAQVVGLVGRAKPSTKPEAQTAFLKTRAGKAVAARKG